MPNLAGIEIELGHKYNYAIDQDKISERGIAQITGYIVRIDKLNDWWVDAAEYTRMTFYNRHTQSLTLPNNWEWCWMAEGKGKEYSGSLAKRLSKWVKNITGVNLTGQDLTKIANIAQLNHLGPEGYVFDFWNKIDWNPGAFGEKDNSCWWGSMAGARKMLTDNGGLAMRFYKDGQGYARAWVVPHTPRPDMLTVFNGYGFADGYNSTSIIARVLADWLKLSYGKIELINEDNRSPTFYINDNRGYVIGLPENIYDFESYDYHFHDPAARYCSECHLIDRHCESIEGAFYCQSCIGMLFERCSICFNLYHKGLLQPFGTRDKMICPYCSVQNYWECPDCGHIAQNATSCSRCSTVRSYIHDRQRRESEFLNARFGITFTSGTANNINTVFSSTGWTTPAYIPSRPNAAAIVENDENEENNENG